MVIGVQDKGLVGFFSLGSAVHGSSGGKGSVGDNFAESNGLIVLGDRVFVPHPDYNLFGSKESLLRECLGVPCARFVIGGSCW